MVDGLVWWKLLGELKRMAFLYDRHSHTLKKGGDVSTTYQRMVKLIIYGSNSGNVGAAKTQLSSFKKTIKRTKNKQRRTKRSWAKQQAAKRKKKQQMENGEDRTVSGRNIERTWGRIRSVDPNVRQQYRNIENLKPGINAETKNGNTINHIVVYNGLGVKRVDV